VSHGTLLRYKFEPVRIAKKTTARCTKLHQRRRESYFDHITTRLVSTDFGFQNISNRYKIKTNYNFFLFRRWPVSWCVHERDSCLVKGRLPDGMSKICQPKTVRTFLCAVELATLRERGPFLYFPTLCLPHKVCKKIFFVKYPWEYYDFPRAFYNNSLCKIWGANRVYYVELENRE